MIRRTVALIGALAIVGCTTSPPSKSADPTPDSRAPAGMVWIPPGQFTMGSDQGRADERPAHVVELSGFYIDVKDVTNAQFAKFVEATGYKTIAERPLDPKQFPGADLAKLKPGALVFTDGKGWAYVPGANWRHPDGPGSSIDTKMDHPVVDVAWDDAIAYAKWAGKTLPTEAQFEYAAHGGKNLPFAWGAEDLDEKHPQANTWQGDFPTKNDNTDGYLRTSPVGSFSPNGYGLYDMAGNVWQWCFDWYRNDAYASAERKDPKGPSDSLDPDEPGVPKRTMRGGSFLCADCYCQGYRVTGRMKNAPDTGSIHVGFRCVVNPR